MTFGNWDCSTHESYEQIKRIAFSQRIKPANVSINSADEAARIVGTDGIYTVTLNNCTCYDFESRQLPCKHIYRLAFKLGYLNDLPSIDRKASKSFKDNIPNEIERFKESYLNGAISIEKFNKIVNALLSK